MVSYFNQVPIHYTITGKGPSLVLLHGFLLSAAIWDELAPKLSKKNNVIIIDLPGHGESGCVSKIHTMELMAEVVNFILEENNINQASFIGHSMGGYISLAFAEKYRSKVNTLVLLNSSTKEDAPERKIKRDSAIKIIKHHKDIFIKMAIIALFPEDTQIEFQHYIGKLAEEAKSIKTESIIAAIRGMKNRKDRTSILTSFEGNKFIIAGIEDPLIPFSNSEKISIESQTKLFKVGTGHMSVKENIEEIINIMRLIGYI
jgi:pimeloyl-ACP methyl ester carboxylesterase